MCAALDQVTVRLIDGHRWTIGFFDLADGFGEIAFIADGAGALVSIGSTLGVEYYIRDQVFRFQTRVLGRLGAKRLRLERPRRILRGERVALAA